MAKKISKKTQPEAANAAIETPVKKPARKRAAKTTQPVSPAPETRPLDQDVKPKSLEFTLDYPRQDERVTSPAYTLRFSVPEGASAVEVSIDGGLWAGCRFSVGHWWYDWADYADGKHTVAARAAAQDGREAKLERAVKVSREQTDLLR